MEVCGNYVATNHNLWKRRLRENALCQVCEKEEETIEQVLLQCEWTLLVWYGLEMGYKVGRQKITSIDRWLKEVMVITREKSKERMRIIVAMIWWQIWKERCRKVFRKKNPNPWRSIRKIQKDVTELMALEGDEKRGNGQNERKEEEKWEKLKRGG